MRGKDTKIEQDIYYIKQTPSYTIFAATQTNPDYFEVSYVFWEHNYSVGKGTTVFDSRFLIFRKSLSITLL